MFFVFIFAANIFLRTAASVADIVVCRRNDKSAPGHLVGRLTVHRKLFTSPAACLCCLLLCKAFEISRPRSLL